MGEQGSEDSWSGRDGQDIGGCRDDSCGAVRALRRERAKGRVPLSESAAFAQARHAVVLSALSATRRQARISIRAEGQERRDERQTEDGQKQKGQDSLHVCAVKHFHGTSATSESEVW